MSHRSERPSYEGEIIIWSFFYIIAISIAAIANRRPLVVTSLRRLSRSLSSMICWRLPRPLASFRLSIYDIGGLPFLLLPSTFPWRSVVISFVCLLLFACPTYLSLLIFISLKSFFSTDSSSRMLLFVRFSVHLLRCVGSFINGLE